MRNDLTKQREYFNKAIETLRNRPAHTFKDGTTITFNEFYDVDKTIEDIGSIFTDAETGSGDNCGKYQCEVLNCSSVEEAIGIMVSMAVSRITDNDDDILCHKRKEFAK